MNTGIRESGNLGVRQTNHASATLSATGSVHDHEHRPRLHTLFPSCGTHDVEQRPLRADFQSIHCFEPSYSDVHIYFPIEWHVLGDDGPAAVIVLEQRLLLLQQLQ